MKKMIKLTALTISVMLISSCSTSTKSINHVEHYDQLSNIQQTNDESWYFAKFYPIWPEDKVSALFYLDTLIADQVIGPILAKHRENISLWRFHRRAAKNRGGHRFSFIFYSDSETAKNILSEIENSNKLNSLIELDLITRFTVDNSFPTEKRNIEDTSDGNWPKEIQRSWPYYIMGVSEMWLDLIQQLKPVGSVSVSRAALADQYYQLNEKITELWEEYGQHAYLHHLNALYGYEGMILREKRWIRF